MLYLRTDGTTLSVLSVSSHRSARRTLRASETSTNKVFAMTDDTGDDEVYYLNNCRNRNLCQTRRLSDVYRYREKPCWSQGRKETVELPCLGSLNRKMKNFRISRKILKKNLIKVIKH